MTTPLVPNREQGDCATGGSFIWFEKVATHIDIYILGGIYSTRAIFPLLNAINEMPEGGTARMIIHSPGGSIGVTLTIMMAITNKKLKIVTGNIGEACSCGSLFLTMGHKVYVEDGSMTMFHHAATGGQGRVVSLNSRIDRCKQRVEGFLRMSMEKGFITKSEHDAIVHQEAEIYINSSDLKARLDRVGLLTEEI